MNNDIKNDRISHSRQTQSLPYRPNTPKGVLQNRVTDTFDNGNSYLTPDLKMAAFLKARGMQLIGRQISEGRTYFAFEDRAERSQLIREYFNNASIGVTDYKNCLDDLKTMLRGV